MMHRAPMPDILHRRRSRRKRPTSINIVKIGNWDQDQPGRSVRRHINPLERSQPMSTESTISRHLAAISQGIDTIMLDYASDSVLITPDAVFRGPAEIRVFFERFMAGASPELLAAVAVTRLETHGEFAYLLWK